MSPTTVSHAFPTHIMSQWDDQVLSPVYSTGLYKMGTASKQELYCPAYHLPQIPFETKILFVSCQLQLKDTPLYAVR